ncbi:LysR family transcriptional regulator [Cupriavidus sp. 2SB]|uniref:LysR family transcriptional regulator n=1 Tax=Cupriavidus sp. 2SB TaxID=2502199 RepID=UPI0010F8A6CB|nr:LysR family transcriptional regulator [Cupriavidus sp. 2SB]
MGIESIGERTFELWAHIHSLVLLSEHGSFTATALRLGISKSAMSQRIADLERAAGVPLVHRTTRSVSLTDAGRQLAEGARANYEDIQRGFVHVKDLAGVPRGVVRMTAPVALGRQQLVPKLPGFFKRYPGIRVELDLSDRFISLAREGFDLAIRHADAAPDTHVAWSLCRTQAVLVASRAYLRRKGTPETPADLANHDCLQYVRPGDAASWTFSSGLSEARHSVPVRGSFSANNSEALQEAALGGMGIALVPDFTAQADLASGKLVRVLPTWLPAGAFGEQLLAIRPYSSTIPRAVRVLVDYWREALKKGFLLG